jgi:hypothetical protein
MAVATTSSQSRLRNTLPTPVRRLFDAAALALFLCGCAVAGAPPVHRIALLAPFEGRYREVGYDALYAGRLAFTDAGASQYEFLPLDDGGTSERAADRARAVALDRSITAAVVLGYSAADEQALAAFDDLPVLVVGNWIAAAPGERVYIFSNPAINAQLTAPPTISVNDAARLSAPVTGGEVFALPGFAELRESLSDVTVLSSGSLPDADFEERYRSSDPFAPPPGLLATLTYDAVRFLLQTNQTDRESVSRAISDMAYEGLSGTILFENGYWQDAPIHAYRYQSGQLTAADDVVE